MKQRITGLNTKLREDKSNIPKIPGFAIPLLILIIFQNISSNILSRSNGGRNVGEAAAAWARYAGSAPIRGGDGLNNQYQSYVLKHQNIVPIPSGPVIESAAASLLPNHHLIM